MATFVLLKILYMLIVYESTNCYRKRGVMVIIKKVCYDLNRHPSFIS
jgi:hypothetical protein